MKNKKKQRIKKITFISSLSLLIFLLMLYIGTPNRTIGILEGLMKDIVISIQKIFTYPIYQSNKNKEVDQTENYVIQKNINDTLVKEIEELKNVLELKQTMMDYEVINATVLSRNKNYWFHNMILDKGKSDGIDQNMIVITNDGLIGKISKVSNKTSEVKLITTNDKNYKISVEIVREDGNIPGILNGYDVTNGLLIVEDVDNHLEVIEGQSVITSGLGGVFPRGIYIGKVKAVEMDKLNLSQTIKVEMKQDFNNIHYVSILKRNIT